MIYLIGLFTGAITNLSFIRARYLVLLRLGVFGVWTSRSLMLSIQLIFIEVWRMFVVVAPLFRRQFQGWRCVLLRLEGKA